MTKFSRPNSFTKLNRSSPLADGLVFWFAGNRPAPVDVISGRALTPSGTPPTFVRTTHGAAWQFAATYFLSTWTPVTAGPYTISAWYSYTASAIRDVVSIANASTETDFVQMQAIGNTAERPVRLRIGDSGGTTSPDSDITTPGHQQSVWGQGAIVIQNPTSRAVYANGRHKTTNTASRTPSGLSRIGIGVQAKSALASTFTGFISDVCIWNRVLSDGEILSLYQPETRWQLYEQKRSIWVVGAVANAPISGSASATLDALTSTATGVITITGAASPTLGTLTASATGALAIVGSASVTLDAVTLAATGALPIVGTLTKTLDAATLAASSTLPAVGTLAKTLGDATVSATSDLDIAGLLSKTLDAATIVATCALPITGTTALPEAGCHTAIEPNSHAGPLLFPRSETNSLAAATGQPPNLPLAG